MSDMQAVHADLIGLTFTDSDDRVLTVTGPSRIPGYVSLSDGLGFCTVRQAEQLRRYRELVG